MNISMNHNLIIISYKMYYYALLFNIKAGLRPDRFHNRLFCEL